jgi:hypothetical protein
MCREMVCAFRMARSMLAVVWLVHRLCLVSTSTLVSFVSSRLVRCCPVLLCLLQATVVIGRIVSFPL